MERRTYLRVVGTAAVVGAAGCLDDRAAASDYDVGMSTTAFRPETRTVAAGETVVWRNTSKQGHTVTAFEGSIPADATYFASGGYETEDAARAAWDDGFGGRIQQGETYEHTFDVPGSYGYFCVPHERANMVGTIEVE